MTSWLSLSKLIHAKIKIKILIYLNLVFYLVRNPVAAKVLVVYAQQTRRVKLKVAIDIRFKNLALALFLFPVDLQQASNITDCGRLLFKAFQNWHNTNFFRDYLFKRYKKWFLNHSKNYHHSPSPDILRAILWRSRVRSALVWWNFH